MLTAWLLYIQYMFILLIQGCKHPHVDINIKNIERGHTICRLHQTHMVEPLVHAYDC